MATVLNVRTGQVKTVRRRLFTNPTIFNPETFVEVVADAKSYLPSRYKPMSVDEFIKAHPEKLANPPAPPVPVEDAAKNTENNPEKD